MHYTILLFVSVLCSAYGLWGNGRDQNVRRKIGQEWDTEMYPAAIAECWLRFIKANKGHLEKVLHIDELGTSFIAMLDRICLRLALKTNLPNVGAVDSNIRGLEERLASIGRKFSIEFEDVNVLVEGLKSPLIILLNKARPPGRWWPFSGRIPMVQLPRFGRELLLMKTTLHHEIWIPVMSRLADPMLLVLETAKMLGEKNFELFGAVYWTQFMEFQAKAIEIMSKPMWELQKQAIIIKRMVSREQKPRPSGKQAEGPLLSKSHSPCKSLGYVKDVAKVKELRALVAKTQKQSTRMTYGAYGTYCTRNDLHTLIQSLIATNQVMDSYMSFLTSRVHSTRRIPLKRILSTTYEMIVDSSKTTYLNFKRANLNPIRSATLTLFPVSIGSIWTLTTIFLSPKEPWKLSIYSPIIVKRDQLINIGGQILDSISSYFEDLSEGYNTIWEEIEIVDLPLVTDYPTRSSGLVMGISRSIATEQDIGTTKCHEIAVYQAAMELLTNKLQDV